MLLIGGTREHHILTTGVGDGIGLHCCIGGTPDNLLANKVPLCTPCIVGNGHEIWHIGLHLGCITEINGLAILFSKVAEPELLTTVNAGVEPVYLLAVRLVRHLRGLERQHDGRPSRAHLIIMSLRERALITDFRGSERLRSIEIVAVLEGDGAGQCAYDNIPAFESCGSRLAFSKEVERVGITICGNVLQRETFKRHGSHIFRNGEAFRGFVSLACAVALPSDDATLNLVVLRLAFLHDVLHVGSFLFLRHVIACIDVHGIGIAIGEIVKIEVVGHRAACGNGDRLLLVGDH